MNFTSVLVFDGKKKSMWLQYLDETENRNPRRRNYYFQGYFYIVGICDGLVCIIVDNFYGFICNPSTGQSRTTSRSRLPCIRSDNVFFGFAFIDNEYKLFRIVYFTSDGEFVVRAEVYSMRTDIWTEIRVNKQVFDTRFNGEDCLSFLESYVAINEVFYWKTLESDVPSLVSFDMNGYVFDMISCPEEFIGADKLDWQLVDLKGQIALTSCCRSKRFDVWVLNEKERSWTMKLRTEDLSMFDWSLTSLGFEKNDDYLVIQHQIPSFCGDFGTELFSYDMESHKIMSLPFVGIKLWQSVYLYTESLLSV